ncbi:MAG: extracellular solute-binding protein [Spirochaetaceae bacterium]|jgi:multiple sugar transport system substrate-binding protein|nr:extracellular solute-binding protein [Spirochaetaceae bacterium]
MKKFDIAMICLALAVLVCAFLFYPAKKINLTKTTLTFSQWLKDDMDEKTAGEIIAEFEKNNPAISVILANGSYQGIKDDVYSYLESALDEISGDVKDKALSLPDIVLIDPLWINDSEKQILFEKQNDLEIQGAKQDGYTAPLYSYFTALFYNIDILEDAGFDRPPKTRGEFEAICLKLKEKNIYGLSLSEDFFAGVFPWIWAGGNTAEELNILKDKFDFTGRNTVESIDFLNRLNKQNALGRPPFIYDESEKIKNFIAGKTAMITASSRLVKRFTAEQGGARFQITAIPYPENRATRPVFNMNSVHAAVLSTSEHKEEALEFVRFLETKKQELASAAGALPGGVPLAVFDGPENAGRTDAAEYAPVYDKAKNIFGSAETVDDWQIFSACAALNRIGSEEMELMFSSDRNAADTAAAIQRRYAAAIKRQE